MMCRTPRSHARVARRRSGAVMVYTVVSLVTLCGLVSLAVDYGHVQSVRQQMQRSADAAARAYLDLIYRTGYTSAVALADAAYFAQSSYNPIDAASTTPATVAVIPGTWDSTTSTFTPQANSTTAVKVVIYRHGASGNGVPLYFGKLVGRPTCDVNVTAIAAVIGGQSGSVSVPSTASLYLAGLPAGSTTAGWGDNTSNAAPYQVTSIPVVPGTYVTVTSTSGTSSIVPGTVAASGAQGSSTVAIHHGENYNGSPNPGYDNPEHGIADANMPADALCGVFLNDNPPTSAPAPTGRIDWTQTAQNNQPVYSNIQQQQPFMIGTGQTTGGTTKQFLVPVGATRLYLSVWDGVQYSNNTGSISGTIGVQPKIMLAK